MISLLVKEKMYINEVVLGTGFGILMGPYVANVFDPRAWGTQQNRITLEVMRIVLVTGLFAVGVELPCAYMKEHAKSLLIMVVPTMAFGWVVVASVLHGLFPSLDEISALCIAACLTPTDPVTCAAITRGKFATKHVPINIRRILSAESAANDGLAYPFLSISLYLTLETSTRAAIGQWFLIGWLYQVILGTFLGAVLGLLFSKLMKLSHRYGFIDRESYIAQYLALSIFTAGVVSTIGADDLLAAFAAGSAISWDGHFNIQTEDDVFSSVIDYVMNCGCFIYIGAWLPFNAYNSPELGITPLRLVILTIVILVLRRIPALLLLYRWVPEIASWKEALFSGHFVSSFFAQMGVSAIFVSALALTRLPVPANPPADQAQLLAATIQPVVSFVVLASIIIHGLSIPFFNLGRGVRSRTTSLSLTWTNRSRPTPDWVLWARRPEGTASAGGTIVADVERGAMTSIKVEDSSGDADSVLVSTANNDHGVSASTPGSVTTNVIEVPGPPQREQKVTSILTKRRSGNELAGASPLQDGRAEVDINTSDAELGSPPTSAETQTKTVRFPPVQ
ncbi:Sodium/hydrogen exchanger family-domain-containing protein [Phlebopus sp. FC_14]|nr:Sodium/hydrogen exchanger family-domain-containing protein [Phlebopus sp. FC_14]